MPTPTRINRLDVAQLVVGAFALGFPVAMGDEVRSLSESMPWTSMISLVVFSLLFMGAFIYYYHERAGTLGCSQPTSPSPASRRTGRSATRRSRPP